MPPKTIKRNQLMKQYFARILSDYPRNKLAEELGLSDYVFCQITTGRSMCNYQLLLKICMMFERTTENIIYYINEHPELLFWYWNDINPDCLPIEKINLLITKMLNDTNITRTSIAESLGIKQTYLSKLEYGTIIVNFPRFESICALLGKDCLETLRSFKTFTFVERERKIFGEKIKKRRIELNVSVNTICEKLKIITSSYEKFEKGEKPLSIKNYVELFKLLQLDYKDGITEAFDCQYIYNQNGSLNYYLEETEIYQCKTVFEGELINIVNTLYSFETFVDEKTKKEYPARNVAVAFYLSLFTDLKNDVNGREQLMYYLDNLDNNECLAMEFSKWDMNDKTLGEIVTEQKEKFHYSHQSFCLKSGYSIGYSSSRIKENSFVIPFIVPISKMLNIPLCVILEYIGKQFEVTNKTLNRGDFELSLGGYPVWTFLKCRLPKEKTLMLLKEILSKDTSKTKIKNIEALNIPYFENVTYV